MVAAIHAGWRGAVSGIASKAVDLLCSHGAHKMHLVCAIGPCIGPENFEVGKEVIEAAKNSLKANPLPYELKANGKANLNLAELIRLQLLEAGILNTAIDFVGGCTYSNPDRYFSYRRDGGETGRHLSYIMLEK